MLCRVPVGGGGERRGEIGGSRGGDSGISLEELVSVAREKKGKKYRHLLLLCASE